MPPLQHNSILAAARQHHRTGRLDAAESLYRQAWQKEPENAAIVHYLGLLLHQRGKLDEGIELMRRAIALAPDVPEYVNNLATGLGATGREGEALELLDDLIRQRPSYVEARGNRGVVLEKLGRLEEAAAALREALAINPAYAEARHNLPRVLAALGKDQEALESLHKATLSRPNDPEAHWNYAAALRRAGRIAETIPVYRRAIELRADVPQPHNDLGLALLDLGQIDEAIACLRHALRLNHNFPDAHWNLSLALLLTGNLEDGWLEYEWRRHLHADARHQRPLLQPPWNGSPVAGRTLLLTCEQGLGDTIQFSRYARLLTQRGAHVILECQPRLRPLLEWVKREPGQRIDIAARGERLPAFDLQARLLSLPGMLGTTLETIPAEVPYIEPDPQRVLQWKQRLDQISGFRVGIAWQGSSTYAGDAKRSMPLKHFAPLAAVEGVRLLSLQKGRGVEQIAQLDGAFEVREFDPPLDEAASGAFLDTAAVMRSLDLVVTSDTAIAHLAGALGVRVWVALPQVPDWRWLLQREDSPWYPTMRLFRQESPGDWSGVFERIAHELRVLAGGAPRARPISIPVSPGELLDKISILQIKTERFSDPAKLANVRTELAELESARDRAIPPAAELKQLLADLKVINERLWDVEDALRQCEQSGDFGERFIELARRVYQHNDTRADFKRRINVLLASRLVEEKQYQRNSR